MRFNKKQCRYTSLLVTLCIILSCLVSYTSTISTPFIDQAASVHSEEAIYNIFRRRYMYSRDAWQTGAYIPS